MTADPYARLDAAYLLTILAFGVPRRFRTAGS